MNHLVTKSSGLYNVDEDRIINYSRRDFGVHRDNQIQNIYSQFTVHLQYS